MIRTGLTQEEKLTLRGTSYVHYGAADYKIGNSRWTNGEKDYQFIEHFDIYGKKTGESYCFETTPCNLCIEHYDIELHKIGESHFEKIAPQKYYAVHYNPFNEKIGESHLEKASTGEEYVLHYYIEDYRFYCCSMLMTNNDIQSYPEDSNNLQSFNSSSDIGTQFKQMLLQPIPRHKNTIGKRIGKELAVIIVNKIHASGPIVRILLGALIGILYGLGFALLLVLFSLGGFLFKIETIIIIETCVMTVVCAIAGYFNKIDIIVRRRTRNNINVRS